MSAAVDCRAVADLTSLRPENASDWHPRKRRLKPRSSSGKPRSWSRAQACRRRPPGPVVIRLRRRYCGRISSCRSTTPSWPGCTVGDVLADPERFEGETLADPLEGVDYGPLQGADHAPVRRHAVDPFSFAHGRTVYELKHDAASVRKAMEKAAKEEVVATFALFAVGCRPRCGRARGRCGSWPRSSPASGLHAINATLKAAVKQHACSKPRRPVRGQPPSGAIRARCCARRSRRDPWLPQMDVLNEVIGAVSGEQAAGTQHRRRHGAGAQASGAEHARIYRRQRTRTRGE